MSDLYIHTLFDHKLKPLCTGIKDGERITIVELYREKTGISIKQIQKNCSIIRDIILRSSRSGRSVVLSDFKSYIKHFGLPLELQQYNVYDLHLPNIKPTESFQQDHVLINKILEKMENSTVYEYQKIMANAAVVYQDLENNGLLLNYTTVKPIWSQRTFSGRSKTSEFNVQGYHQHDLIRPSGVDDSVVLIHFDWICADIRVASLLSVDKILSDTFIDSDPYLMMAAEINSGKKADAKPIDRDTCKQYLLKSINSLDITSDALLLVYPSFGKWIGKCKKTIKSNGSLETMLQRKFRRQQAKNDLAVFNGAMQGSVAHAMQLVIRHIWEQLPRQLVAEIHDSLVVCSRPDVASIRKTINIVTDVMLHPFRGVLPDNPVFPLQVSIGKRWKKWKTIYVYRESGVTHASKDQKFKT